jgi:hypothetical protein
MLEVQKEWESFNKAAENTPPEKIEEQLGSKNEILDKMLNDILRKHFSQADQRCLAASCGTLLILAQDRTRFANAVLDFLIVSFLERADRDSLVTLMSTRCPLHIGPESIEFVLVHSGTRIKDPILVLGDAYTKCKTPEVRCNLASAARRAFAGHIMQSLDDAEFVKNAMQWYEKEKDHLKVNYNGYSGAMPPIPPEDYNTHSIFYEDLIKYERHWLFQKKPTDK